MGAGLRMGPSPRPASFIPRQKINACTVGRVSDTTEGLVCSYCIWGITIKFRDPRLEVPEHEHQIDSSSRLAGGSKLHTSLRATTNDLCGRATRRVTCSVADLRFM